MDLVQGFFSEVDKGREGKGLWIPIGHNVLNQHIGMTKKLYTLVGGAPGTGKTAMVDSTYVINPYEWWLKNKNETDVKIKWLYRSMERSATYKIAKWVCQKLQKDYSILLDVPTMLGWGSHRNHISEEVYQKIKDTRNYFEEMLEHITIIDGSQNPTGVFKQAKDLALRYGKETEIDQYHKTFTYNDDNQLLVHITDHIGKLSSENNLKDKGIVDKHSEYQGTLRDRYGYFIVDISQFNRNIEDTFRNVKTEVTPLPSDFKESSDMYENADIVLALFNPYKLKIYDHMKYDIKKFLSAKGANRFRSVICLKNSYGIDDFSKGFLFYGETGLFLEIPPHDAINYNEINKAINM